MPIKEKKTGKGCKASSNPNVVKNGDSVPTAIVATISSEVIVETANSVTDQLGVDVSGYTGPLPTHEGKPVVINRNAWAFYLNPQAYGVRHERIRNYLMIQDALRLAEALGRPLNVEDLKILVQPDGPPCRCSATGREFQPMSWVLITPGLLNKIREGMTLEEIDQNTSVMVRVGHFFCRKGKILTYSGTPYRWHKDFDRDQLSWQSPITKAYKANGDKWPMTFSVVCDLQVSYNDRKKELVSVGETIERQLGNWRPSGRKATRV
jgi:hypothetical protein